MKGNLSDKFNAPNSDYTIDDLDPASKVLKSALGLAKIPIWSPTEQDTYKISIADLMASYSSSGSAVRSVPYSEFLLDYVNFKMVYGRQTLVVRPGKTTLLVTEGVTGTIHPITVEFYLQANSTNLFSRIVTFDPEENLTTPFVVAAGSGAFVGNRTVKSLPQIGQNYGGTTTSEWLDKAFFAFSGAQGSMSLSVNKFIRGTPTTVAVVATISPNEETVISARTIRANGTSIKTGETNTLSASMTIETTTTFNFSANLGNNGSPTTLNIQSEARAVLPFYVCVCDTTQANSADFIRANSQALLSETQDVTINITADKKRILLAFPASFGNISAVIDSDNTNVVGGFTQLSDINFLFGSAQESVVYKRLLLSSDYTGSNVPLLIKF